MIGFTTKAEWLEKKECLDYLRDMIASRLEGAGTVPKDWVREHNQLVAWFGIHPEPELVEDVQIPEALVPFNRIIGGFHIIGCKIKLPASLAKQVREYYEGRE